MITKIIIYELNVLCELRTELCIGKNEMLILLYKL